MRIVVLDGYTINPGDNPWDAIAGLGELEVHDRSTERDVVSRAETAEIILTNKTPLSAATIARLPRLQFICELATGYDNVDLVAAGERDVPVANIPEYSTDSVAQHTMALLLELCNRVGEHNRAVAEGAWSHCPDFSFWRGPLRELAGRKLGIIGCGKIGRRVAEVAHVLGLEILAHNPRHRDGEGKVPLRWRDVAEIFATADVVSLHCPVTAENRGFVDWSLLTTMRPDALLINTARGALVNEPDLARALNDGVIAGAGLDVLAQEPPRPDNPLLTARNCLITPHIAWASLAARQRLMATAAANVSAFLRGEPINVVNLMHLKRPPVTGDTGPR